MNYSLSLHWRRPAPINQPEFRNLVCTPIIPSIKPICINVYQTSSNTIMHSFFFCSLSHACIHSFNKAFIYGFIHYIFLVKPPKLETTPHYVQEHPNTILHWFLLVIYGTKCSVEHWFVWKLATLNPQDYDHYQHHHHTIKLAILGKCLMFRHP